MHDAWWAAARKARGDRDGTRALIEVLLLGRHVPSEHLVAGLAAALRAGALSVDAVALEARKAAESDQPQPATPDGPELVTAVNAVLTAAGFTTVDLDAAFGDSKSADLLATVDQQRRLIEVKSASGTAAEKLVGHLQGHLQTWPGLRPNEPVDGGALIVNHQYRDLPSDRSPQVYSRPEFVTTLPFPVIGTQRAVRLVARERVGDDPAGDPGSRKPHGP